MLDKSLSSLKEACNSGEASNRSKDPCDCDSDDSSDGGLEEHWKGIDIDLVALHKIVCQVFRVPLAQCGPPIPIGEPGQANYARVYSFQLPTRKVVARLVYPTKPLFKTEGEVAAMDFVRNRTSLPVPEVFAYCSEASNPVGVEWLIMEHMPGVDMDSAWDDLGLPQKRRLALDIIDVYDQLFQLKADGCGSIYHSAIAVDDSEAKQQRSPRWAPLSLESLSLLKSHCKHSICNDYDLGPLNDLSLFDFWNQVPSPSATMPVFSSNEYVKLVAFNGNPSTRSEDDIPTREKCVELFESIYNLYPNSTVFGPSADSVNFRFSHGDLHEGNILIDPQSGAITGIIDWECGAFRPLWSAISGIGGFEEDGHRFLFGCERAENFVEDTPQDTELRAFFRTEMNKRNPDLFTCFLGAIELRAVVHAAKDYPRPLLGKTHIFLSLYHDLGYWNEDRRGAFPWDMLAWKYRQIELDQLEMARERVKSPSSCAKEDC